MRRAALIASAVTLSCAVPATRSRAQQAPSRDAVVQAVHVQPGWTVRPDRLEDCRDLSARLAAIPAGTRGPARGLGEEGARLCADGHLRTGLARLRRAIHLARNGY